MVIKAIAKGYALTGRNGQVSGALGLFLEVVQAKWVGREQAVVAHMPGRGMTGVIGMIKDGDAERFRAVGAAGHRTVIVAPIAVCPPSFPVAQPRGHDNMALARSL